MKNSDSEAVRMLEQIRDELQIAAGNQGGGEPIHYSADWFLRRVRRIDRVLGKLGDE